MEAFPGPAPAMQEALDDHQRMSGAPSARVGAARPARVAEAPPPPPAAAPPPSDAETTRAAALEREYARVCSNTCMPDPAVIECFTCVAARARRSRARRLQPRSPGVAALNWGALGGAPRGLAAAHARSTRRTDRHGTHGKGGAHARAAGTAAHTCSSRVR